MSSTPEDKRRRVRSIVVIRPTLEGENHQNLLQLSQDAKGGYIIDLCDTETTPSKDARFAFPAVYGHQAQDLNLLCVQEVEPLLQGCLNGESAAVIAYGETGAGKSYICGTEARPGDPWQGSLGSYLARRLWEAATKGLSELLVECSMIEIYREKSSKEQVFDLLAGYQRKKVEKLYEIGTERIVTSPEALLARLQEGAALRNTDKTDGNARSSRSHAIFTVRVQHTRCGEDGTKERVSGRFLLVDLAGAEAASSAEVGSAQQKQGSGINTGLSALQTVIIEASKGPGAGVVQYRSSRLTNFLKPALGGGEGGGREGCNAVFLGCIKPFAGKGTRTRTTLQYIRQAANIRNVVHADVESVEARRDRALSQQIEVLRAQNKELAAELQAAREGAGSSATAATEVSEVVVLSVSEHQALLREVQEGKDRIIALEVVLKGSEDEHNRLKEQLATALTRAEDAERAAAEAVAVIDAIEGGGATGSAALLAALTPVGGGAPREDQISNIPATASIGVSPGLAALAVSPILSAARTVDAALLQSLLAQQEPLEIEEICLDEEESHLEPDQLGVLYRLVESRLADAASGTASKTDKDQGEVSAAAAGALHRRTAEVAALRLVVAAYNECLGNVSAELENMRIKEAEATAQLHQAAREKVQYVDLTAKFSEALDISQDDVRELQTEVKELRRQSILASSPGTNLLGRMAGGLSSVSPKAAEKSPGGGNRSASRSPRPSIIGAGSSEIINSGDGANNRAVPSSTGTSSRRTSALHALGAIFHRSSPSPAAVPSPAVPSPSVIISLENSPIIVEEEEQQPGGFEHADFGPVRHTSLDAFPLEDLTGHYSDLDLSDEDAQYDGGDAAQYDDVIDLVEDGDSDGGGGGGGGQPPRSVLPATATAIDEATPPQKALENAAREQQMRMQGGVDVGAISGQRGGQLSEDFIEKNQHWRPMSKRQGRQ